MSKKMDEITAFKDFHLLNPRIIPDMLKAFLFTDIDIVH